MHIAACLTFLLFGILFIVGAMVQHGLFTPVYFTSFRAGEPHVLTQVSVLDAPAACCAIALFYSVLSAMSARFVHGTSYSDVGRLLDGIFLSLLIVMMSGVSDLMRIMLLVNIYVVFRVLVVWWFRTQRQVDRVEVAILMLIHASFWISYLVTIAYNWTFFGLGGRVSQIGVVGVSFYDAYLIHNLARGFTKTPLAHRTKVVVWEYAMRLAVLLCVYVDSIDITLQT